MKLHTLLTTGAVILSLAAGSALAQDDKAKKQAEIRKVTATSLEKFYKADPKLKEAVAKAPGYAVFTTYGFSFIFGGAGGKGVAQDNKTKSVTYMDMAQASAGLQVGAAQSETLIIFKNAQGPADFHRQGLGSERRRRRAGGCGRQVGRARRRRAGDRRRVVLRPDAERAAGGRCGRRDEVLEGQGAELAPAKAAIPKAAPSGAAFLWRGIAECTGPRRARASRTAPVRKSGGILLSRLAPNMEQYPPIWPAPLTSSR